MHLTTRNVNTAFRTLVDAVANGDGYFPTTNDRCPVVRRPSRNGPVLTIDEPVTVTYTHPRERVLFNTARDANPFFHLYEALWMLAGRNDVAPLAYYVKRMEGFSDDGKTFNGAYGWRWRNVSQNGAHVDAVNELGEDAWRDEEIPDVDQLEVIAAHLKADPNSRRAVLQMWNVEDDLLKIEARDPCREKGCVKGKWQNGRGLAMLEEGADCPICKGSGKSRKDFSKDVCCNLSVMLAVREEAVSTAGMSKDQRDEVGHDPCRRVLDMTVTNRSNDLVWGMLGANYVHFTVLQEYVAARLGVSVGRYHHFTNNLHVYEDRPDWKPAELLANEQRDWYEYGATVRNTVPLVRDPVAFEADLPRFVEHFAGTRGADDLGADWSEPFLDTVAAPLLIAFACHKERDYHGALNVVAECAADDWRTVAERWLRRRCDNHERRGK